MAKKNSRKSGRNNTVKSDIQGVVASTPQGDDSSRGLLSGISAVTNMISDADSSAMGGLGEALLKSKDSLEAAGEEAIKVTADKLEDNLQDLVGELKAEIVKASEEKRSFQSRSNNLEQKEASAASLKTELDELKKQLAQDRKKVISDKEEISTRKAELSSKERELEDLELDAEAGFAEKNKEMLEKFRAAKESENQYFERQKEEIKADIQSLKDEYRELRSKIESESRDILLSIESRKNDLEEKQASLEEKETNLDRLRLRIDRQERLLDQYREEIKDEIRNEFIKELDQAKNREDAFRQQLAEYSESEKGYQEQLASYAALKQELGEEGPAVLFDRIAKLKYRNDELQDELDLKPSADLEEKYQRVREEKQDLLQTIENKDAELSRVTTQMRQNRTAVIDKEGLSKENLILSKHNELLGGRIEGLREEVDDLLSKQQSKTAFPALLDMDKSDEHNRTATTESVGNLSDFVSELKHRIAWDEETGKELYFREEDIRLFIAGLSMSRLHVLQGISGTGKTSLAKAFARAVGGGCTTVSVQAGWRDKDDLIGHYNSFEKQFYERPCLQGLYEAQTPFYDDRPYIVLLDEMNLSRPEQYFAEFLSALELDYKSQQLSLMTSSHIGAPLLFKKGRLLQIPKNIWFIGTANHDETTFEFADKTYDRAHVMELPRNEHHFDINKSLSPISYSYKSLENAFSKAESQYFEKVKGCLDILNCSDFVSVLGEQLGVSWGNRLERQAHRFVSTMLASGGGIAEAFDHLLATKVLRQGKATGRYDTEREDIETLNNALTSLWQELGLSDEPIESRKLLEKEIRRKSAH